jgi:uncharacterized Fe-S cluster protein YjdI
MAAKEYTNGDVTVVWQHEMCAHSEVCVRTLPKVYDPKAKPWITLEFATSQEIIEQVGKCPSGALSIKE